MGVRIEHLQDDIDRIKGEKVYDASVIGKDNPLLSQKNKGGGFGLMNCKGIIEKYRKSDRMFSVCSLDIKSEKGYGSRFSFRLPKGVMRIVVLLLSLLPSNVSAGTYILRFSEHSQNALSPNVGGTGLLTLTVLKLLHLPNALSPISVTPDGILT